MGISPNRRFRWLYIGLLLITSLFLSPWAIPAQAQAQTCPYATLRLDSSQAVNFSNICQAAQPWFEQGYQVLVYLTDAQPATEDEWYSLLDQVETEAGLRDLSLPDSFQKNGLALAAQARAPKHEVSVTYGETLYETPIDTSPKFEGIKQNIRVKLGRGDTEEALIYGLQDMYGLNYASENTPSTVSPPATPAQSTPPLTISTPQPAISPQQPIAQAPISSSPIAYQAPGDPWGAIRTTGGLLVSSGLGIGLWQRRRQQRFRQQCQLLQARISTLLMACNDLLAGDGDPTGMILYSLFEAAGGRLYPDLEKQVKDWLIQARQALDQAFIVQDELQQQQPKWLQSKHVQSWEELYLTLIGQGLYHEKLTDKELRVVLDPMQTLAAYRWENQLAAPLKEIQQRLAEASLSIELITIPAILEGTSLGILGTLQQIKEKIAQLRKAETEAPQELTAMRTYRQTIASAFPTGLNLSSEQALQGIDNLLHDADSALEKNRFLDTLLHCKVAQQGLNWLEEYSDAISTYRQHQADIQTILTEGFRPPQQGNHQTALAACLETGQAAISTGDYASIPNHLAELHKLDQAALYHVQQWQQLCYDNRQQIEILKDELSRLQTDCAGPTADIWQTLQAYPAENWESVETCLPTARQILTIIDQQDLPQAAHLNCLNEQSFYAAKEQLEVIENNLKAAQQQLDKLKQQAELIEKMSRTLTALIERTSCQLKAVNQVGQGGILGMFKGIDTRLRQALDVLPEAHPLIQERCYVSALKVHDQAGHTMLTVYRERLDTISSQVNRLINDRDARNHGRYDYDQALQCMSSQTDIAQASGEEIHKLYSAFNQAWELLKAARRSAKAEIHHQEERRRRARERRESSSSSSFSSSRSSSRRSSSSGSSRRSSSSGSSRRSSSRGSSRRR